MHGFLPIFEQMTVKVHTQLMEALRPSIYQVIYDGDTKQDASNKRLKKSVDHSLKFLDQCLEEKQKSDVCSNCICICCICLFLYLKILKDIPVFAAVVGGYNKVERQRSAKETKSRNVDGTPSLALPCPL
jgi:queuine tRNA-ribosyltransferase subunit QTRTD1